MRSREAPRSRARLAVDETVILMTPPCLSLLKHQIKVQGGAAEWQSRQGLWPADVDRHTDLLLVRLELHKGCLVGVVPALLKR